MQQIILADRLRSAQSVLLVLDLSLRNFLSLQSYLTEFSNSNPNVRIDLWVNSNCWCPFGHRQSFQEKLFTEFLAECNFISNIYFNTCSVRQSKKFCKQIREYQYSAIALLSKQNIYQNIKFAKKLNPQSFLVGPSLKTKWFNFFKRRTYKGLSASFDLNDVPQQLFGDSLLQDHKATLVIPRKWISYAKLRFMKWGIDKKGQRFGKVYFVNVFDDDGKSRYPLEGILGAIKGLKQNDEWDDVSFVLHAPPSNLHLVRKFFAKHSVNNMILFSSDHNFFQMPSILSLCDGVLSVDGVCADMAKIFNINLLSL